MLKRIITLLLIIIFSNCSNNTFEFKNIDDLMQKVRNKHNLDDYPELLIDGYDFNYKLLKGKLNILKNDIGYIEFIQNGKNGKLNIITKLPEIKKSKYKKFYVELNNTKINFEKYKNIKLNNIKKKVYLSTEKLSNPKFNNYEEVILIFTKKKEDISGNSLYNYSI